MTKKIIITGANRGIGYALAELCLKNDIAVWAISRSINNLETLQINYPQSLHISQFDISRTTKIKNLCADCPFEQIDYLVNNAGLLVKKPFLHITEEELDASVRVNFYAPYFIIQTLLPKMNPNGHMVNISTMGAVQGSGKFPELTAYGSSKAAIANLTEVLAEEIGNTGPSLNCLALGAVQTDMLETAFPGYHAGTTPAEMAAFILNFLEISAPFFHGKILPISNSTP